MTESAARRERRAQVLAQMTKRKVSKYRNTPTEYGGIRYDSRAEADYAASLDLQILAGTLQWWDRQPTVLLGPARILYRPDFIVESPTMSWYVDVKGVVTPRFRVVRDLWRAHGPALLLVVYKDRTERIEPE